MNKQINVTERYKAQVQDKEAVIVDVIPPSGFVFQFKKPSRFGMLFQFKTMPQIGTSGAITKWSEEGIIKGLSEGDEDTLSLAKIAFDLRDRVLELSHNPKLVVGPARADNELSTDDVSDDDLTYLFRWVQAGGETSMMLGTFPIGSKPDTLASASRAKQRNKAQPNGRA